MRPPQGAAENRKNMRFRRKTVEKPVEKLENGAKMVDRGREKRF